MCRVASCTGKSKTYATQYKTGSKKTGLHAVRKGGGHSTRTSLSRINQLTEHIKTKIDIQVDIAAK